MTLKAYVQIVRLVGLLLVLAITATQITSRPAIASSLGMVVGWGHNGYGRATAPPGLIGVIEVAGGGMHSLALKGDGTVVAWGDNSWGQLNVPEGLNGVTAIAAGGYHNLALKADGTVVAWGGNFWGQTNVPTGLSGVTRIAAGYHHSLALKSDGTVVVWGNHPVVDMAPPAGLSGVTAIASGPHHSLAVTAVFDTIPPIISAPAAIVVNATSPAGAEVSFSVEVEDNVDPNPVVVCTPSSGSVFPIGTTVVSCTATDATGNSSSASFSVRVKGATEQLADLIARVQELNLGRGISNSLDAKLQNALDALEAARAGSITAACNKLDSFINEVEAQAGNGTLTSEQAEQLISAANRIKAVLGGS